jgi:hypothetical protein
MTVVPACRVPVVLATGTPSKKVGPDTGAG